MSNRRAATRKSKEINNEREVAEGTAASARSGRIAKRRNKQHGAAISAHPGDEHTQVDATIVEKQHCEKLSSVISEDKENIVGINGEINETEKSVDVTGKNLLF